MATILTLYEHEGQTWSIHVDEYGCSFANETNNNRVFVYDYKRWACDAPESLPKYIRKEMYKLVSIYGPKLNNLEDMLRLNRLYRETAYDENIMTQVSIGNAAIRRFIKQCRNSPEGPFKAEVYINSQYGYIETLNADDILAVAGLQVEYKGKLYRAQYIDGCFKPYLAWSFIERKRPF